jgi:hypothetical protein
MYAKKKRGIFLEVERVKQINRFPPVYVTKCAGCSNCEVDLVSFQEAAKIAGTNLEGIIYLASTGVLHLALTPDAFLICLNSLINFLNLKAKTVPPKSNKAEAQNFSFN